MARTMIEFHLDPRSGAAPYLQIVQQVKEALRLGLLDVGDQLPTVREVVAISRSTRTRLRRGIASSRRAGLVEARPAGARSSPARSSPSQKHHEALRREFERRLESAERAGLDEESIRADLDDPPGGVRPPSGMSAPLVLRGGGSATGDAGRCATARSRSPSGRSASRARTVRGSRRSSAGRSGCWHRRRAASRCSVAIRGASRTSSPASGSLRARPPCTAPSPCATRSSSRARQIRAGLVDRERVPDPSRPHRRVSSLSAGEWSRLALAVALGKRPSLILLDEPFERLDPLAAREFLQLLMDGPPSSRPRL